MSILSNFFCILAILSYFAGSARSSSLTEEVDPFVGSANGGNTFPGAVLPWGMVSVSPHNKLDAPSGYIFGEKKLYGFGHVHLSGVGCPDLGNIVLMPQSGPAQTDRQRFAAAYSDEISRPGYYRVRLPAHSIVAEMSATTRTGFSRYTFEGAGKPVRVLLDLGQAMQPVEASSLTVSASGAAGWAQSGGFCGKKNKQRVHFQLELSPAPEKVRTWPQGATFEFAPGTRQVLAKVGISYVSADNARENLRVESSGWELEGVRSAAQAAWEPALGRLRVKGGGKELRGAFYTALYHALLHPNVFSDVNGDYLGLEHSGVKRASGREQYTVYSLWDTYRTLHPFLALAYPERQAAMVQSLAAMAKDSGRQPKWELAGNETHVMVGDPAAIVMADSYLKGFRDYDVQAAFNAAWASATTPGDPLRPGLKSFLKHGYIAQDDDQGEWVWGSVSSTLEYCLADWSLGRWAEALGKRKEAAVLFKRAAAWRNFYDPSTGFLRPKLANGAFLSPFDPLSQCCDKSGWPDNGGPGYVEGNAWQYTWFVPHDIPGLIEAMGGEARFAGRLGECFDKGHYVMWNEPDMAYPWLFNYVPGMEGRTRKEVRETALRYFVPGPKGIPGNDDCGTTSAWFLWAALGLYPDNPVSGSYQLAAPLFEEIALEAAPGRTLRLKGDPAALAAARSVDIFWRGAPLRGPQVRHAQVAEGGLLEFKARP